MLPDPQVEELEQENKKLADQIAKVKREADHLRALVGTSAPGVGDAVAQVEPAKSPYDQPGIVRGQAPASRHNPSGPMEGVAHESPASRKASLLRREGQEPDYLGVVATSEI